MTDDKAEFVVVTRAVRDEAKKWADLAPGMQQLVDAVDALDLLVSAFWVGPLDTFNAMRYSKAYNGFQQYMLDLLKAAVVEFGQLSKALTKIANEYDRMDAIGKLNLDKIFDASQLVDVTGTAGGAANGPTGQVGASSPAAIGLDSLNGAIAARLRNTVAQAEAAQAAAAQAAAAPPAPTLPTVQLPTQPLVVTQPYLPTAPPPVPAFPDLPPPPPPPPAESNIPTVLDANWFTEQLPSGDSTLTITVDGEEL